MANEFGRIHVGISASVGGLTKGLSQASSQIQSFAGTAGKMTKGAAGGFASLAENALGFGRAATVGAAGVAILAESLRSLLLPLGIIAAITAPFAAFAQATQAAEQLHNLSRELGVAAGDLQVMQMAAGEAGVDHGQLTAALRRTVRMTGELASGSKAASKAFSQLGLSAKDFTGLNASQQFALIADRIRMLPPAMQAAAAVDIFGKQGQSLLNFVRDGGDSIREMDSLLTQLGVKMSGPQVAAIEMMGDALGRLELPVQGLVNQFLAGVAPAITTTSNLIVQFFAENTRGWSIATTLAEGFAQSLRLVVGAFTLLYGIFQVFQAAVMKVGQLFSDLFSIILEGVANVMSSMATLAEASGFDDLADSLRSGARGTRTMSDAAGNVGTQLGEDAGRMFENAVENITNPFGAFDTEMAAVRAAAAAAGQPADNASIVAQTVAASSKELRAAIAGSVEGDSIRNAILRGDPRMEGSDDAKRTADASERAVDELASINSALRDAPGFGQAQVALV